MDGQGTEGTGKDNPSTERHPGETRHRADGQGIEGMGKASGTGSALGIGMDTATGQTPGGFSALETGTGTIRDHALFKRDITGFDATAQAGKGARPPGKDKFEIAGFWRPTLQISTPSMRASSVSY